MYRVQGVGFRASCFAAAGVTCRNGSATHPGVWWGGIFGEGTSLVPNKPIVGVLVYSSHPLLAQASAQLYSSSGCGLREPPKPISRTCKKLKPGQSLHWMIR